MCPARIECPDRHTFIVPDDQILDDRLGESFNHLTEKDKEDLEWRSIFGTKMGYSVILWGRQDVSINVTSRTVKSDPAGYENNIKLESGNVLTLHGGTKVFPVQNK